MGGLFQTLGDKISQLFSPVTSLAHSGMFVEFWTRLTRKFSQCFWSAFLAFRKMRFRTESAKTYHPKHPQQGTTFWSMVSISVFPVCWTWPFSWVLTVTNGCYIHPLHEFEQDECTSAVRRRFVVPWDSQTLLLWLWCVFGQVRPGHIIWLI